jgi:VWFA-related protein
MTRFTFVALAVGIASGLSQAQQPIFRTSVEFVQLDTVVTDRAGTLIKTLTQEDFEIAERGRAQTLAAFQFLSIPPTHRTVRDITTTVPSVDVASNTHAPAARQWVLVIDDLHIIETHVTHTKNVVQEFLESLPADDQVAVVFIGRSDFSQDFTSDLNAQLRAVNHIKESLGFAYDANDNPQVQGGDGLLTRRVVIGEEHAQAETTARVLKNVASVLTKSTFARKALVWVSEGMTYSVEEMVPKQEFVESLQASYTQDFFEQLQATFTVARQAGVPVYPIDPRGIPDCTAVRGPCSIPPLRKIRHQWDNMRTLADETGGKAFYSREHMADAVRELIEDNSSVYLLGYYPNPFDRDGKFHEVTVTVKGHPEYTVRARAGYTAPKSGPATTVEVRRSLEEALGAPLPASELTLRAFAAPAVVGTKGMKTAITLHVTYPIPGDGASIDDTLEFGIVALDHDGKMKGSVRRSYHATARPVASTSSAVTYTINDVMDLPPQPLTLRIGVASHTLHKTGVIHVPVDVIRPSRSEIQISTVAIGFAGPPREDAVPADAFTKVLPFQPTTIRTFSPSDTLRVFVPMFWSGAEAASVSMSITQGHSVIMQRHDDVTPIAGMRGASLGVTLPLVDVPTGSYILSVTALVNGRSARRDVAFDVR